MLLDYNLDRLGLDPAKIKGYEMEEFTHTTVAAAGPCPGVAVHVGMVYGPAARALDLDFVPVATQQCHLLPSPKNSSPTRRFKSSSK